MASLAQRAFVIGATGAIAGWLTQKGVRNGWLGFVSDACPELEIFCGVLPIGFIFGTGVTIASALAFIALVLEACSIDPPFA